MFESWISDFLASSLGHFIDVKTDQLKVSLWKGVIIENVQIRQDAPEQLQLPFQLKTGLIKRLQIQVPWRGLHLSPIIIHLSGVQIKATSLEDWQWSFISSRSHSGVKNPSPGTVHPSLKWRIFTQLWNSLVRRLQLKIDDLEVVFEDQRGPNLPIYSFGLKFTGVRNLEEIDLDLPRTPVHSVEILKIFSVENLSVFWNCDELERGSVLEPCSFRIFIYFQSQLEYKHFDVEIEIPEIIGRLHQKQLVSLMSFLDDWEVWQRRKKCGRHRPIGWRSLQQYRVENRKPRSHHVPTHKLWKYAIQSILDDLSEKQDSTKNLNEEDWIKSSFFGFFSQEKKEQEEEEDDDKLQELYTDLEVNELLNSEDSGFTAGIRISCSSFRFTLQPSFGPGIPLGLHQISITAQQEDQELSWRMQVHEIMQSDWLVMKSSENSPVLSVEFDPQDPPVKLEVSGLELHLTAVLVAQLESLGSSMPTLTLQKFQDYSCSLLPDKTCRLLAFLERQGTIPGVELTLHDIHVWLGAKHKGLGVSLERLTVSFDGSGANKEKLRSCLQENEDLIVMEDFVNRWIYSKCTIQVHEMKLEFCSVHGFIMEPLSANGDVFISLCPFEESIPAVITNWRLTSFNSKGLLDSYKEAMNFWTDFQSEIEAFEAPSCFELSSDGLELIHLNLQIQSNGLTVDINEISPSSIFQKLVYSKLEFSVSCPGLQFNLDPFYSIVSDTVSLTGSVGSKQISVSCLVQKLSFQTEEGGLDLAQVIRFQEVHVCYDSALNGFEIHSNLTGVEICGFPQEITGFVGTQHHPNSFILDVKSHPNFQSLKIGLNGLSIGSEFLTKLISLLFGLSSSSGTSQSMLTELEFNVDRSLLIFPKQASTGESVTGAVLKLTEFQLAAQILDLKGFSPYFEIRRLYSLNTSLLVQRGAIGVSNFYPVLSVPMLSVNSSVSMPLQVSDDLIEAHRRVDYETQVGAVSAWNDPILLESLLSSFYDLVPTNSAAGGGLSLADHWSQSTVVNIDSFRCFLSRDFGDNNSYCFQWRVHDVKLVYEDSILSYRLSEIICFWMFNVTDLETHYLSESGQLTTNGHSDLTQEPEEDKEEDENDDADDVSLASSETSWETAESRVSSSLRRSSLTENHAELVQRPIEDEQNSQDLVLCRIRLPIQNQIQFRSKIAIQANISFLQLDVKYCHQWFEMMEDLLKLNKTINQFTSRTQSNPSSFPEVEIIINKVSVDISPLVDPDDDSPKLIFHFTANSLSSRILSVESSFRISELHSSLASTNKGIEGNGHLEEVLCLRETRFYCNLNSNEVKLSLELGDVNFTPSVSKVQILISSLYSHHDDDMTSSTTGHPLDLFISKAVHFRLSMDRILLSILDDSENFSFPLIQLCFQDCMLETESLSLSSVFPWEWRTKLKLDIFNRQSANWESFFELLEYQLKGKLVLNTASSPFWSTWIKFLELDLQFLNSIEITFTPGMIRVFSIINELLPSEAQAPPQYTKSADFWILNKTGSPLEYTTDLNNEQEFHQLTVDELRPIQRANGPNSMTVKRQVTLLQNHLDQQETQDAENGLQEASNEPQTVLSFHLSDQWMILGHSRLNQEGIYSFPVSKSNQGDSCSPVIVSAVSIRRQGGFNVELRSSHRLLNTTGQSMEVQCYLGEEAESHISLLEPNKDLWIPVMTIKAGWFTLRPLRSSYQWSQKILLRDLPQTGFFMELKCQSLVHEEDPVEFKIQIEQNREKSEISMQIKAPIKFQNLLPVPLELTANFDSTKSPVLQKRTLDPQSNVEAYKSFESEILFIQIHPLGYKMTQVSTPPRPDHTFRPIGDNKDCFQIQNDLQLNDIEILLYHQDNSSISIRLEHQIDGKSGQESFTFICAFWIYNLTQQCIAIREVPRELAPPIEDSIIKEEEDALPNHWMPPLAASLDPPSTTTKAPGQSLGLALLQQKGPGETFRLRSSPSERTAHSKGSNMSPYPAMEISGVPLKGTRMLQLRYSFLQAPFGATYWSDAFRIHPSSDLVVTSVTTPLPETSTQPYCPHAGFLVSLGSQMVASGHGVMELRISPRQHGTGVEWELPLNSRSSIHWTDLRMPLLLSFRVQEAGWLWSGGIGLETSGDTFIKIRHRVTEETILIHMETSLSPQGVLLSKLSLQDTGFAPYRLDNFTSQKLHVRQEGIESQDDVLRPYSSMSYAWDEPSGSQRVILEGPGRKQIAVFNLNTEIGRFYKTELKSDSRSAYRMQHLRIELINEGPVRVLSVLDEDVHPMGGSGLLTHHQSDWHPTNSCPGSLYEAPTSSTGCYCRIKIPSVGISFTSEDHELVYVSIKGIQMEARCHGSHHTMMEFSIDQFQVDTGRRSGMYPILLSCPSAGHPWTPVQQALLVEASIWIQSSSGVLCIEKLHLSLAGLTLEVEEGHLRTLIDYGLMLIDSWNKERSSGLKQGVNFKQKIYIEELNITPIRLNFSFAPKIWSHNFSKKDLTQMSFLQRVTLLANVNGAHLCLKSCSLSHQLLDWKVFSEIIARHYTKSLIHEIYKVLGSADILGDPMGLLHHLGLGVWSLFANPAYTLSQSNADLPRRLLIGFQSGITSLVSNVVYGVSNAIAKISSAARNGLIVFGMQTPEIESDLEYVDLLQVVLLSWVGVLKEPIEGLDSDGVPGFFHGVSKGGIGLISKPLNFLLEMFSNLAKEISQSLSLYTQLSLIRVPRRVLPGQNVESYDPLTAIGGLIIQELEHGAYLSEKLIGCFKSKDQDGYLVLTRNYLLMIKFPCPVVLRNWPILEGVIPLKDIELVKWNGQKISIFGFIPSSGVKSRFRIRRPVTYPYFMEVIDCLNMNTAFKLSFLIKKYAQTTSVRFIHSIVN
eukprot:g3573.t1